MKILQLDTYLDGGTVSIHTDEGQYCFDERLPRLCDEAEIIHGQLWKGYPGRGYMIEDETPIINALLEALRTTFDGTEYINYIKNRH